MSLWRIFNERFLLIITFEVVELAVQKFNYKFTLTLSSSDFVSRGRFARRSLWSLFPFAAATSSIQRILFVSHNINRLAFWICSQFIEYDIGSSKSDSLAISFFPLLFLPPLPPGCLLLLLLLAVRSHYTHSLSTSSLSSRLLFFFGDNDDDFKDDFWSVHATSSFYAPLLWSVCLSAGWLAGFAHAHTRATACVVLLQYYDLRSIFI